MNIILKALKENNISNYFVFGGRKNSDRSTIIFSPEKFSKEMVEKNYSNILKVVRIKLPKNIKYEHREFLSGIMKLGIKREKFGDIIVTDSGADIVVLKEISEFLADDLQKLTRFQKSIITIENLEDLSQNENEFDDIKIIVSSLRLDNLVSELAKTSRGKAEEFIKEGLVFVNSINEFKDSKKINVNDIITIRGKGKFIFYDIERTTSKDKIVLNIKKFK